LSTDERSVALEGPARAESGGIEPSLAALRATEEASAALGTAAADRRPVPRAALVAYLVATVAFAAGYLLLPRFNLTMWGATVVATMGAFVAGIVRNRPRRRTPWILLGAGYLAFAGGTVVAVLIIGTAQFPSVGDAVFLVVVLPLLLGGLVSLTRSGAPMSDRATIIDAVMLTTGAGFLAWTFLINPFLQSPDLRPLEKAVSIAYPITDLLTLAILARLGLTAARSRAVTLLIVSGVALMTSDVLYGLSRLEGGWHLGGPMDVGWLVFYIAGGAAAMHPSMIKLTEPHVLSRTQVTVRRGVLTVASLLGPAALLLQSLRGPVHDGLLIAGVSALLVLLALARMAAVAGSLRQTLARERQLRLACEALLVSSSTDEVAAVLRDAVGQLLPPGVAYTVVLHVENTDRSGLPDETLARWTGAAGALELRYAHTMPAETAAALAGFELALCCRLAVAGHTVGELVVGADERTLISLQDALQVLAGQAATMIDRISLSREIIRRDSQAYFRTLVLNATEVIAILDDDNRFTYVSPAAEQVFGTAELAGESIFRIIDPSQRAEVRRVLDATRAGRQSEGLDLWLVRRTDDELVHAEVAIGDMRADAGVRGLVVTLRDVSERRRLEQELLARAYVDPLTGLGNRLQLQDDVTAAAADTGGAVCGVMVINVDDFRVVNDTMGHEVGDELLIAVAKRLSALLAGRGTVARLGADEFGAVIDAAAGVAEIEQVAEQVIGACAEPFHVGGSVVTARLRAGVATTAHATTAKELLGQADVALDSVKSGGPTRWRRYEASLHAEVIDRMQLRTDLDRALTDNAFAVHYQPIVELSGARTVGYEALLRWPHPTRGMVPPDTFIPVAEESGLIVPLGAWVLRTAVREATRWRELCPEDPPYVSVNVSVRQFRMPDFVDQVFAELECAGLPPDLLTVEITESLLLGEHEEIEADIARLRAAGIKVSIDDFGTGYSSLSYLHRVPVDILKLDKSFVDTITTSRQQLDLVRGIIQLAGTLALEVVAEGVETEAEHRLLAEAGCGLGQGYLFARPMPEADVLRRLCRS
jgi:diguanylate cyclase (GGDEF)-like protein/PAS domain S-box-containing protein